MDNQIQPNPIQDRVYHGRPENQRDPNARRPIPAAAKPPAHAGERGTRRRVVPATINKPTRLPPPGAQIPPPRNDDPAKSSVFAMGSEVREISLDTRITPSTPILVDVSRMTYAEMIIDDPNLQKVMVPEYLDYYSTALLWMRIINLKVKLRHPLTIEE